MDQAIDTILSYVESYPQEHLNNNFSALIKQISDLSKKIVGLSGEDLRNPEARKFHSLVYLGAIYLLTGKLNRQGVLELFLGLPYLCPTISKYDEYFEGLKLVDFRIPYDPPQSYDEDTDYYHFIGVLPDNRLLLDSNDGQTMIYGDDIPISFDMEFYGIFQVVNDKVIITEGNHFIQWNPSQSDNQFKTLMTFKEPLDFWAISSEGTIAFSSEDLLSIFKDQELNLILPHDITRLTFVDEILYIQCDNDIYMWDGLLKRFDIPFDYHSGVDFLKNGRVAIKKDQNLKVYDSHSRKIFENDFGASIISNDLVMLQSLDIIDINTGQLYTRLPFEISKIKNIIFLPGDKFAISFRDRVLITDKLGNIQQEIYIWVSSMEFSNHKLIIRNYSQIFILI